MGLPNDERGGRGHVEAPHALHQETVEVEVDADGLDGYADARVEREDAPVPRERVEQDARGLDLQGSEEVGFGHVARREELLAEPQGRAVMGAKRLADLRRAQPPLSLEDAAETELRLGGVGAHGTAFLHEDLRFGVVRFQDESSRPPAAMKEAQQIREREPGQVPLKHLLHDL